MVVLENVVPQQPIMVLSSSSYISCCRRRNYGRSSFSASCCHRSSRTNLFVVVWCVILLCTQNFIINCNNDGQQSTTLVDAFAFDNFQLPKFPWGSNEKGATGGSTTLEPTKDTIAVIGASGNVGKLVSLRLSDHYQVNGIVRDSISTNKVKPFLGDKNIKLYECNLLQQALSPQQKQEYPSALRQALEKANALVICTGTTAFPTKAWSRSSSSSNESITNAVIKALWSNSFDKEKALQELDMSGYSTPNNIDYLCNQYILQAWSDLCQVKQKRVIMLSSIGVQRRTQMPFPILNTCGVLDAKARGEEAVKVASEKGNYAYTIIRPGQLFGGPYDNNYYLGTLFQLDKDSQTQGDVQVQTGDTLLGDTLRTTLAEVTTQICLADVAKDTDFAVVNTKGSPPTIDELQQRLQTVT